jgi:hypothetical protein
MVKNNASKNTRHSGSYRWQFSKGGIDQLEIETLFATQEVKQSGGFPALLELKYEPDYLINETKLRILA